MKNNIILMTSELSFLNNYGAALQGCALVDTMAELGYNSSIVKYQEGQFQRNPSIELLYKMKRFAGQIYHRLRPTSKMVEQRMLERKFKHAIQTRTHYFEMFENERFQFFNDKRVNWHELLKNPPISDIYVCGSDQIWNPYFKNERNDPGYFLAFAPEGAKKIAYAPSFGCSDLPEKAKEDIGELLKDFSAISVREKSGVDIVRKYAHRDAKWVVDPTLLRTPEQWKKISRMPKNIPEKYIVCYRFAESDATRRAIDEAAGKLGLPVVSMPLSMVSLKDPYQFVFDAGPREFIGLIQNAALVCTDSFHATIFSILMKTPVCVFLRENYSSGNSMNSRVYSLLRMLHLEQLIKTEQDDNEKVLQCMDIDYTEAHRLLTELRTDSMSFLENALKG